MSDIQKVLIAIADQLAVMSAETMQVKLYTIARTLDGVSKYYHDDAVKAAFSVQEEVKEDA